MIVVWVVVALVVRVAWCGRVVCFLLSVVSVASVVVVVGGVVVASVVVGDVAVAVAVSFVLLTLEVEGRSGF